MYNLVAQADTLDEIQASAGFPGGEGAHSGPLRYEVLGPLRVHGNKGRTFISARKIEIVLAVLVVRYGNVVSMDRLLTEIWGENLPRRAIAALQVYISQLRKLLAVPGQAASPIVTRSPGYLLNAGRAEIDSNVFQDLVAKGRAHARAGQHHEAVDAFDTACRLWRGPALSGLEESPSVRAFSTWLEEARLDCAEQMVESKLALGQHRDLIGFLFSLIADQPLHEPFYCQLMVALYRSGRQADALKVYQSAWETIRSELGLEPCRNLRDLQRALLAGDPDLERWAS